METLLSYPDSNGNHDMGECEQLWGYTCEACRQEYQERMIDWQMDRDDKGWEDGYSK